MLEVIGLAVLSAYTLAAFWQLGTMRGQLEQMKGSSGQTDQMLCLVRQQVEKLTQQATDTHALAVAAKQQADVMATDLRQQRPWIGEAGPDTYAINKTTNRLDMVEWHFRNGGRTTAIDVRGGLEFRLGPPFRGNSYAAIKEIVPNKDRLCTGESSKRPGMVALQGIDQIYPISILPDVRARLDDVYITRTKSLYLVGCITYFSEARRPQYHNIFIEWYNPEEVTLILIYQESR
jgi:hypothetical protein